MKYRRFLALAMFFSTQSLAAEVSGDLYALARQSTAQSTMMSPPGTAMFGLGIRMSTALTNPNWRVGIAVESTQGRGRMSETFSYFSAGENVRMRSYALKPFFCYDFASWSAVCFAAYQLSTVIYSAQNDRSVSQTALDLGPEFHVSDRLYGSFGLTLERSFERRLGHNEHMTNASVYLAIGTSLQGRNSNRKEEPKP